MLDLRWHGSTSVVAEHVTCSKKITFSGERTGSTDLVTEPHFATAINRNKWLFRSSLSEQVALCWNKCVFFRSANVRTQREMLLRNLINAVKMKFFFDRHTNNSYSLMKSAICQLKPTAHYDSVRLFERMAWMLFV